MAIPKTLDDFRAGLHRDSTTSSGSGAGFAYTSPVIPGSDGQPLPSYVVTPTGQGNGPFPLVLMPTSWALPDIEYLVPGALLASSGYVCLLYTSRGFYSAGGTIDIAGPATMADVTTLINWALANTPSDPKRIGMVGISYGAGISVLATAFDPRVRVASGMSAWTDLGASFDPNQTVSTQAGDVLALSAELTGKPGPYLQQITNDLYTLQTTNNINSVNIPADLAEAPPRSAITYINQINANHPAILISNGWNDSLFPPSQFIPFFSELTGAKQLDLTLGDHGSNDALGLIGISDQPWQQTTLWLNHYLQGAANGINQENPFQLTDIETKAVRTYPTWAAVSHPSTTYLSQPSGLFTPTGSLGSSPATGWRDSIAAGVATIANSGTIEISGILQQFFSIPIGVSEPLINRANAGVWDSPWYWSPTVVQGSPELHLTVTPSSPDVALFAYLYDVDPLGLGGLLTCKPYTILNARPGVAQTIDFNLEPTAWTVPAGDHLTLVIGTVDARWFSASTQGTTVTFSSPPGNPSWLNVPL